MNTKHALCLAIIGSVLSMASCQTPGSDPVRSFMPGTYVRTIRNEFTHGADSIIIGVLDEAGGTYLIEHRSSYTQTMDGKALPAQQKVEKWTGVYDAAHHQLQGQQTEKVFSFVPDKNELMTAGGMEYKKIK